MGSQGELLEVLKHVFAGKLKPVVDRTFPLQRNSRGARIPGERGAIWESRAYGLIALASEDGSGRDRLHRREFNKTIGAAVIGASLTPSPSA